MQAKTKLQLLTSSHRWINCINSPSSDPRQWMYCSTKKKAEVENCSVMENVQTLFYHRNKASKVSEREQQRCKVCLQKGFWREDIYTLTCFSRTRLRLNSLSFIGRHWMLLITWEEVLEALFKNLQVNAVVTWSRHFPVVKNGSVLKWEVRWSGECFLSTLWCSPSPSLVMAFTPLIYFFSSE